MSKDTIYRQDAIDALDKRFDNVPMEQTTEILLLRKDLRELPSAEKPFKLPEIYVAEGFDTVEDEDGNIGFGVYVPAENKIYVAGDVEDEIRARALLHEVCHWVQDMCGRPFGEDEANEFSDIVYDALPSAQPKVNGVGDLISRQDAIDALGEEPTVWYDGENEIAERDQWRRDVNAIKAVPSAQPERKKGKWLRSGSCIFPYECDQCGDTNERATPFCPNCGADMRGKEG